MENENLKDMTQAQVAQLIAELSAKVERLSQPAKNRRPGVPGEKNVYVRLTSKEGMDRHGRIPPQQDAIAEILERGMERNKEYSEKEVFDMLIDGAGDYRVLYTSKQDPTYLFKYYRGLNKRDGKHLGFILRGFLKVV